MLQQLIVRLADPVFVRRMRIIVFLVMLVTVGAAFADDCTGGCVCVGC